MKNYLAILILLPYFCLSQDSDMSEHQKVMAELQRSHIEGNVPSKEDFDTFLKRDLKVYFNFSGSKAAIKYQLLRDGPTQSGVGYPKYYLWVQVTDGEKIVQEGAARVSAIEKTRFEISHFLSKSDIKKQPDSAAQIFPATLLSKINQLAEI